MDVLGCRLVSRCLVLAPELPSRNRGPWGSEMAFEVLSPRILLQEPIKLHEQDDFNVVAKFCFPSGLRLSNKRLYRQASRNNQTNPTNPPRYPCASVFIYYLALFFAPVAVCSFFGHRRLQIAQLG